MKNARFNLRKNIVYSGATFVINASLVFLSYRLIIRNGGLESLGLWSSLYAMTSLIRIGDAGVANATLRFVAMRDSRTDSLNVKRYIDTGLLSNAILFTFLAAAGFGVISYFLPTVVSNEHLLVSKELLPLMMASFILFNISGIILGSIQGLHFGYISSRLSVLGNLFQIALVIILVPSLGLVGLAWAQILQYSLSSAVGWVILCGKIGAPSIVKIRFSLSALKEMLSFSVKAQFANIANGLFEPLSKILMGHFFGLHAQGIYELALKTLWIPRNAIISGVSAMTPAITALLVESPANVRALYQKAERYSTAAVLITSLGISALSPIIARLWIGEANQQYTIYTFILTVGVCLNAYGASAYNLGLAAGVLRGNIIVNCSALVLLAIFGVSVGAYGDAYAMVSSVAICMGVAGVWIKILNTRLVPQ